MLSTRITIMLLLSWLQASAYAAVQLTDQVQHNFGIHSVSAVIAQSATEFQASAKVLDASGLVGILADLKAAHALANASKNELKRLELLYQTDNNAALKTVEAARAQVANDLSHVESVQAQLLSNWGGSIVHLSPQAQEQLLQSLLKGQQMLVRADLADQTSSMSSASTVHLKGFSDDRLINAKVLGALPQTQGQSLGKSYLLAVSVNKQIDLQPGQVLIAQLQDTVHKIQGVRVPKSAVVRWQGQQWVYVEPEAGHFQRVGVSIAQWIGDDVLISKGIKAGDKVVTSGAGLILGAELSPPDAEKEKEE